MTTNAGTVADIRPLADVVRDTILAACEACGWNLFETAKRLGIAQKSVYNHLNKYAKQGFTQYTPQGWRRAVLS